MSIKIFKKNTFINPASVASVLAKQAELKVTTQQQFTVFFAEEELYQRKLKLRGEVVHFRSEGRSCDPLHGLGSILVPVRLSSYKPSLFL